MKKSPLMYLSFLGLLGLLGFITGNYGFFGFFGFFGFLVFSRITNDERLRINIAKAGLNGFIISLAGLVLLIVAISIWGMQDFIAIIIAATFVITVLTFVISFMIYDSKGN